MELIRQERIGIIKDVRISQMDLLEEVESLLESNDTLEAAKKMKTLQQPLLLLGNKLKDWQEMEKVLSAVEVKEVPDSSVAQ